MSTYVRAFATFGKLAHFVPEDLNWDRALCGLRPSQWFIGRMAAELPLCPRCDRKRWDV